MQGVSMGMMARSGGQVAMEYLLMLGFVTLIITFIIGVSQLYARDVSERVAVNQADRIVNTLVDKAEKVYYFGEPTRVSVRVSVPEGLTDAEVDNNYVTLGMRVASGTTQIYRKSEVNISGDLSRFTSGSYGIFEVVIQSAGDFVWINAT